jgi:hypothetical protein
VYSPRAGLTGSRSSCGNIFYYKCALRQVSYSLPTATDSILLEPIAIHTNMSQEFFEIYGIDAETFKIAFQNYPGDQGLHH